MPSTKVAGGGGEAVLAGDSGKFLAVFSALKRV
jgi:hypothetical protein